jgi:hypothetical protein
MTSIQASGGFADQPSVGVCVGVLGGASSPGVVARQRCAATARGCRSAAPPRAARRACLSSSITAVVLSLLQIYGARHFCFVRQPARVLWTIIAF